MFRTTPAFSGFSVDDIQAAKEMEVFLKRLRKAGPR